MLFFAFRRVKQVAVKEDLLMQSDIIINSVIIENFSVLFCGIFKFLNHREFTETK